MRPRTLLSFVTVDLTPGTVLQAVAICAVLVYGWQQADDIRHLRRELFQVRLALIEVETPESTRELSPHVEEFPAKTQVRQKRSVDTAAVQSGIDNHGLSMMTSHNVIVGRSLLDTPEPTSIRVRKSSRQRGNRQRHRKRQPNRNRKTKEPSDRPKCNEVCTSRSILKRETEEKSRTKSVHFIAKVDSERLARMSLNDSRRPGNFEEGAFIPGDRVLRIWEPERWMDGSRFSYNQSSGMARVKRRGIYMVYAQVVFYDSAARKSIGLYVNESMVPIVEAISFDVMRSKRSADSEEVVTVNSRSRRMAKLYSQCNFMGMVYLRKNDRLSIKCSEDDRGILAKDYLTYWGITHISSM